MSCAIPFSSCFQKAFFALEEASFANNPIFAQMILPQIQFKRLLVVPLSAQIDQFTAFGRRKLVFFFGFLGPKLTCDFSSSIFFFRSSSCISRIFRTRSSRSFCSAKVSETIE